MLSTELLALLRCPEDHSKLSAADRPLVARLNDAVAAGRLKTRSGQKVEKPLDDALIRADGRLIYPIVDGIPVLLVDDAIWISELDG
ncbi:MAG TPA: hypothetical protein VFE46_05510 [Pirellulales bacterium]|jgi:uncharacterized protein YbaR (Trm112 family)|nr:hypothetical protein [Pirellulales bacterium]